MDVKFYLTKGNPKGKTVDVPAGILKIGRAEDSDLIIASTRVSRHHCEIANDQDRLVIRDNGSANGTFVNRQKIQEQILQPGDQVQVGPLTFVVEINGVRKQPSSPAAQKTAKSAKAAAPSARPSKPAAPKMPAVQRRRGPEDIAATLERLSAGKQPDASNPRMRKKRTPTSSRSPTMTSCKPKSDDCPASLRPSRASTEAGFPRFTRQPVRRAK